VLLLDFVSSSCYNKTAGNGVILQMYAEFRGLNASNVIGPTKPSITASLYGVVKLMTRLTLPG